MKLEIQKDLLTQAYNLPHQLRPLRSEQLAADLEEPHLPLQPVYQAEGFSTAIDVECDNDLIHGEFSKDRTAIWRPGRSAAFAGTCKHFRKPLLSDVVQNLSPVQKLPRMFLTYPLCFGLKI